MNRVKEHYENLLARHYTWMFATSFENKVSEQKTLLEDVLESAENHPHQGLAVDLGSGPGYQSLAFAQLGFSPVIALDSSPTLLHELQSHRGDLPIQTLEADLSTFSQFLAPGAAEIIVCMGDTITHLESKATVLALFDAIGEALAPGGTFILTYRDLSAELSGLDRFIPVHSDHERVMTCFLEFDQPDSVQINDLVYFREGSQWKLEKSNYRKLRLPVAWVEEAMSSIGLTVTRRQVGRLICLMGRKHR